MDNELVDISKEKTQQLLLKYGDVLEKTMFADDKFFQEFPVYGEVWSRYILPNREVNTPTFTTESWRDLAASHYSAIVRCWTVRSAADAICRSCEEILDEHEAGLWLLSIQQHLVTFFSAVGAAHDNIKNCFNVWPVKLINAFPGCRGNSQDKYSLAWLYDRRTQTAHMALVPIDNGDGTYSIDLNLFRDKQTKWDETDWQSQEDLVNLIKDSYCGFHGGMSKCWNKLFEILQKKKPVDKPQAISWDKLLPSFGSGTGSSSGVSKHRTPLRSPVAPNWPSGSRQT